jgi:outer membrane protein assembly factor BamB
MATKEAVMRRCLLLLALAGPTLACYLGQDRPGVEPQKEAAGDWPTFLHDNRRSGHTDVEVKSPLKLAWSRQFRRPPAPAWPEEAKADYYHNRANWKERIDFDCAFHTVGVGEHIYLGSSSEDKVVCLDALTGNIRWQYHTEGPVRCAPTIHEGRLYVGSDDGYVYCLETEAGKQVWRTRIADSALRVPGNQRMISLWPVRTDVLIDGGKGHVCAGVFPSQEVYEATLDLKDGTITKKQTLKVTAQGYLERKFGKLMMVSTGRNPIGALLGILEDGDKAPGKEANLLKDYPFGYISAGETHFAGGDGKVAAFDKALKPIWQASVEGKVYGLMALRGRLYVSTDTGIVYCFSADGPTHPRVWEPLPALAAFAPQISFTDDKQVPPGYCLVAGKNVGLDVYRLASETKLQVIGLEPDAEKARTLRAILDAAGLAGRATVHEGSLEKLPYTSHVFNLVVAGLSSMPDDELFRVTQPVSGIATRDREAVVDPDQPKVVVRGTLVPRPFAGAGTWTHQYGGVGNTACSGDERVGSDLQIQWFGKPGPRTMIDRHHRTSSPLYLDGRLFVPGEDTLTGVDAYNGTILWEKTIPDSRRVIVFRDASQLALAKELLYVAAGDRCFALYPGTGNEARTFSLPKAGKAPAYEWDYVACADWLLVGSGSKKGSIRRNQNHQQTLTVTHWDFGPAVGSDFVFAMDREFGHPKWTYESKAGLLINQTFTIGDGRFYFVESDNPATLATPLGLHPYSALTGKGATLVALDLVTGKVLYRQPLKELEAIQHNCFGLYSDGKLVLAGSRNDGTDKQKSRLWYDIHVYEAATGKQLWTASQNQEVPINCEHGEQERHPAIVGGKLYCEPKAYDLATGKPLEWNWPWQKNQRRGCGTLAASASAFYFRDESCQAFNLEAGKVSAITTETRPGCWINMIPAGGLVLVPEGSSGCTCNHSVQTSLALIPVKDVPKR